MYLNFVHLVIFLQIIMIYLQLILAIYLLMRSSCDEPEVEDIPAHIKWARMQWQLETKYPNGLSYVP